MDSTLKIALYAATVSTMTGLVQVFNYRRDRADIKIRVKSSINMYPETTIYDDKNNISVNVINRGRRPIMIMQCCIKMPIGAEPRWLSSTEALKEPRKLNEGEYTNYMLPADQVHQFGLTINDIVVYVLDPAGREYWADNLLVRWWKLLYGATKFKSVEITSKEKG